VKGILITSEHCPPCDTYKEQLKAQIESGEVEVKKFEENEAEVMELMKKYGADLPSLLILGDNGEVILNSSGANRSVEAVEVDKS
jgi:hypothetical protein